MATPPPPERGLDWTPERAAAFAHGAAREVEEFLRMLPGAPIFRRWPDGEVARAVAVPVPVDPTPEDDLLAYCRRVMREYSSYPGHPAFMGYISSPGTAPGAVADMLASTVNQNLGGWRLAPAATEIERALTIWFARRLGMPEGSAGILVSGGSMGTFTALKVARDRHAGVAARDAGLTGAAPLRLYASSESHAVVVRAADMLGMGRDAVATIPVDDRFRLRVDELERAIARDRGTGVRPVAVVGTAGTTATGSVDPLSKIAEVCARETIWFHVDAAYGGGAALLAEDLRPQFAGIERADSIALDPHKWLYTPIPGGCTLFRDMSAAFDSFDVRATYTVEDTTLTGTTFDFGSHGPEWSRGFAAFRVWVSLLAFGTEAYARRISHDAELARYMGDRVREHPDLELTAPVSLSVCCFRYRPPDVAADDRYLDALNSRLMTEVQLDGRAYCSNAVVQGRFSLRACIVNYRTEAEHVDLLLDVVRELGARLDGEMRAR